MGNEIDQISKRIAREILEDEKIIETKEKFDQMVDGFALGVEESLRAQNSPVSLGVIRPKIKENITKELTRRLIEEEKWDTQRVYEKFQYLGLTSDSFEEFFSKIDIKH